MTNLNLYMYCHNHARDKEKVLDNCYISDPNFDEEKTFKELYLLLKDFKICRMKRRKENR